MLNTKTSNIFFLKKKSLTNDNTILDVINAAVGSNAIASSTLDRNAPSNAVDGNNYQRATLNTCAVSSDQVNPWILLDLGGAYTITHIKIFNRLDCCSKYSHTSLLSF